MVIYIAQPDKTLVALQPLVTNFGFVSGLIVNAAKSDIYTINLPRCQRVLLQQSYSYNWFN